MTATRRTWRLDLPWPTPPLRDNDRRHWANKARWVAELRDTVNYLAYSAGLPKGLDFVTVTLCWEPAVRRTRDADSIRPTLKPLIDGLTRYGLVADDDIAHVKPETDIRPPVPRKPSRTWLEIVEGRP